ncbi:EamA family transporter [Candidatus Roizmanbacteria bacterium]|nr:EamA family transporter [Candidatus Roizmanbacteria bacterium]
MLDWKILAIFVPFLFVTYQTLSKLLPKGTSAFLVNAYASCIGMLVMLLLHFLFSSNKSLELNSKVIPIVIGIGLLISLGNFGIIKAYALGAPQSLFTPIFYIALIIYGVVFGLVIWHERINFLQLVGIAIAVTGLFMTAYFKK